MSGHRRFAIIAFGAALAAIGSACTVGAGGGSAGNSESHAPVRQTAEALYTPTPTAIPRKGPDCPVDKVICQAGDSVASSVSGGTLATVPELGSNGMEIICPAAAGQALLPVCANAANQSRTGFAVMAKLARLVAKDEFLAFLTTELQFSRGGVGVAPAPSAVGCARSDESAPLDCGRWSAVAFGPAEADGVPVIVVFERRDNTLHAVAAQVVPSAHPDRGGWASVRHEGTGLPERIWFIPWNK